MTEENQKLVRAYFPSYRISHFIREFSIPEIGFRLFRKQNDITVSSEWIKSLGEFTIDFINDSPIVCEWNLEKSPKYKEEYTFLVMALYSVKQIQSDHWPFLVHWSDSTSNARFTGHCELDSILHQIGNKDVIFSEKDFETAIDYYQKIRRIFYTKEKSRSYRSLQVFQTLIHENYSEERMVASFRIIESFLGMTRESKKANADGFAERVGFFVCNVDSETLKKVYQVRNNLFHMNDLFFGLGTADAEKVNIVNCLMFRLESLARYLIQNIVFDEELYDAYDIGELQPFWTAFSDDTGRNTVWKAPKFDWDGCKLEDVRFGSNEL